MLSHWKTSKLGRKIQDEKVAENKDGMGGSLALTNHNREEENKDQSHRKTSTDDRSSGGTHMGKASLDDPRSDCTDDQKSSRPMSPGTLALMCDEQDTMFATSENAVAQPTMAVNPNSSELYAEQERCVLTEFRDCLRKLVQYGRMKGTSHYMSCQFINNWTFSICLICKTWVGLMLIIFDLQRRSTPWRSDLKQLAILGR
jgi:hypothetical protein